MQTQITSDHKKRYFKRWFLKNRTGKKSLLTGFGSKNQTVYKYQKKSDFFTASIFSQA
jgi:hypothetical protein